MKMKELYSEAQDAFHKWEEHVAEQTGELTTFDDRDMEIFMDGYAIAIMNLAERGTIQ